MASLNQVGDNNVILQSNSVEKPFSQSKRFGERTPKFNPVSTAAKHQGSLSLFGTIVEVNPECKEVFGKLFKNLNPNEMFIVTEDNEGKTKDRSGNRVLTVQDCHGNKDTGNANFFDLKRDK